MTPEHRDLLESAFREYLDRLAHGELEPSHQYCDYEFGFLENRKWHLLGKEMVACELQELTNLLNRWLNGLHKWHAWNTVIANHDNESAWELWSEFLDALAHECLLRPSSIRDTLTAVATNALHQIRLSIEPGYPDRLEGEPRTPDEEPAHLTRRKKENRLSKLAVVWKDADTFLAAIRNLDSREYRERTFDYRNLNSHAIGPRLGIGYTGTVKRSVVQAMEHKQLEDGIYEMVPIPGKLTVSYGFGGTPPLDLQKAWEANVEQFAIARECYNRYRQLLEKAIADTQTSGDPET